MTFYSNIVFILIMAVLSITDLNDNIIPNWIIYPAILIGCLMTHYWLWALVMFMVGILFHKDFIIKIGNDKISDGDVKLFSLLGAFLGIGSLIVLVLSYLLFLAYKKFTQIKDMIPLAPILTVASIVYIIATKGNSIRTLCLGLNP
jgi:prepilin signal peptidase PulO-like enzyme (type II secretory pathway)